MIAQPAICHNCGAKLNAAHDRCPRCRAKRPVVDPVAAAAASRRLATIAGVMSGVFLLVLAGLWATSEPAPASPPVKAASLTGRTAADPPAARSTAERPAEAPATSRPFLDPAGAGVIAYAAGDLPAALLQYQAAIERNPSDAESLSNLGQVLVRLNRAGEAIPHFERAIALIPDRWAYTFNLARALGALGRWQEAVAAYRRAQEIFPDDYVTAFNLALALRKTGDDAGAIPQLERAIALEPNDAAFRMTLGMTYERLQKPADAASAYEEALRLAPQAPDAEAVRARIALLRGTAGGD